jgi:hypothetical protein
MSQFKYHREFYDKPIRLSQKEMDDPEKVIKEFFINHRLSEYREFLWEWVTVSISALQVAELYDTMPGDLLWYYQEIETMLEAAWAINQKRRNKKDKPKK